MLGECRKWSTLTRLVDSGFYLMVASHLVFCDSYCQAWVIFLKIVIFLSKNIYNFASSSYFFDMEYTCFSKIKKTKTGTLDKDFVRCTPLKLIYLDAKNQLNYWTLNVSMKSLSSVCKSVCLSVCLPFVRPSVTNFSEDRIIIFSDILHESWPWYLGTDEARFLKKNKHWRPKFGSNGPKSSPKWVLPSY